MIRTPQTPNLPPGDAPGLARLAHNRLAFGPRPEDTISFPTFSLDAWLDAQLDYTALDDTACEAAIDAIDRVHVVNGQTFVLPPPDATLAELQAYRDDLYDRAQNFSEYYLQRHLFSVAYGRALLSRRQLYELMVDFWTNHLQTDFQQPTKYWEDKHVIRQHALGNFRDLIGASARSPSMLHFLSNTYSDASGPNENYGRELMELHTVGSYSWVPGPGYRTQANYNEDDVHTVAQAFTGWSTVRNPNYEFGFNNGNQFPRHHWLEKRLWLGNDERYSIPFGGVEQGEQIIDILCEHPSTAYRLATKLAVRFISDNADVWCPGAIEAGAQAFLASHGDIKATLRALLLHTDRAGRDFAGSWGQKVKRPFEFFASTMRAMGVQAPVPFNFLTEGYSALFAQDISGQLDSLGQRLFHLAIPTGYPDVGVAWWTSNQVFGRWTLANGLVNKFFGSQTTASSAPVNPVLDSYIGNTGTPPTASQVVDRLTSHFVGHRLDDADRTALVNYLGANNPNLAITSSNPRLRATVGAIAASPYAQWR